MLRKTSLVLGCMLILIGFATTAFARGEKKKGPNDLYLEVDPGVRLADYRGAKVIVEPATIEALGDLRDNELVRSSSDELLTEALKDSELFSTVAVGAPAELPEGRILRASAHLTMDYGSRAARGFIGFGAGKSKVHIHLDLTDAHTGQHLAFFNGYGAGVGYMTFGGGNPVKMAREDIEDNYGELADLLSDEMP